MLVSGRVIIIRLCHKLTWQLPPEAFSGSSVLGTWMFLVFCFDEPFFPKLQACFPDPGDGEYMLSTLIQTAQVKSNEEQKQI